MAKTVIAAELSLDGKQAEQSVGSFKKQLKEANAELLQTIERFGETSKQAVIAGQKVALLKDKIGDAKAFADSFSPDKKFAAFSTALQGVAGGFEAVTGAMGLLGSESKETEKVLLKVQSAMAFSQGLNSLGGLKDAFTNIKAVLINTLGKSGAIGVAIAGVAALGYALFETFKRVDETKQAIREMEQQANASFAKEKVELDSLVRTIGNRNLAEKTRQFALEEAQKKYPAYLGNLRLENGEVKGLAAAYQKVALAIKLKAQAQAAGAILAKKEEEALNAALEAGFNNVEDYISDITKKAESSNRVIGEYVLKNIKDYRDFNDRIIKLQTDTQQKLDAIGGDPTKDKTQLEIKQDADAKAALARQQALAKQQAEALKQAREKLREYNKAIELENLDSRNKEIQAERNKYVEILAIAKKFGLDITDATASYRERVAAIEQKYIDQQKVNISSIIQRQQAAAQKKQEEEKKALDFQEQQENENLLRRVEQDRQATDAKIAFAKAEHDAKVQFAQNIGNALGALADLVGKQTAAGKVLAIAQATINTFLGATEVLRAKTVLPEPFGTIAKIVNVAAVIATGLSAIKNIVKTPVPGGGGGTAPAVSSSPLTPQLPQSANTRLDSQSINAIGNQAVRAFVVETDVSGNQERVRRLNRSARIS